MKIETSLIIHAEIEPLWAALIDIEHWEWNRWTRLEAPEVREGVKGTLRASYEGDEIWQKFPFSFGEIDPDKHLLSWKGSVGGGLVFSGHHHMRLETVGAGWTRLEHNEVFGGLAPLLGVGLPFAKLGRNYRLMNEALKSHIEDRARAGGQ
jgi:hypothetical protein